MAYLHCHGCDWSQDDFWSPDGYNPFRQDIIDYLKKCLFEDTIISDGGHGDTNLSGREFVARELERKAAAIRHMHVMTDAEWQKVRATWHCPKCGSTAWDID
jgi:hypothetical protein